MCLIVATDETLFPMKRNWDEVIYFVEKFAALHCGIGEKA